MLIVLFIVALHVMTHRSSAAAASSDDDRAPWHSAATSRVLTVLLEEVEFTFSASELMLERARKSSTLLSI